MVFILLNYEKLQNLFSIWFFPTQCLLLKDPGKSDGQKPVMKEAVTPKPKDTVITNNKGPSKAADKPVENVQKNATKLITRKSVVKATQMPLHVDGL